MTSQSSSEYDMFFCGRCGALRGVHDHLTIEHGIHFRPDADFSVPEGDKLCDYAGPFRVVVVAPTGIEGTAFEVSQQRRKALSS